MINTKYPTTKPSLNLDFANTKSLDPRITFRRGTPGTYYDGVTHAKAEENLIDYSEDFSQWSKTGNLLNPLLVQDASPVDTNAYKLICDNTTADHSFAYMPISKENNLTSYSIFIKADGLNYAWIGFCYDVTLKYQSFVVDLTSGQILNQYTRDRGNLISVDVVSSGNDWYRVKFISDGHDANYFSIGGVGNPSTDFSSDGRPFFQGDNTSGILVWGAQLEDRGEITSYTATNGTPITKYQPKLMTAAADRARFDHDPLTGESKGLLIEEQRTNLIAYSEDFKSSFWDKSWDGTNVGYSNEHIYSNQAIAPDGSFSASKVSPGSDSGVHYVGSDQANILENTTYTISCYLKKGEMDTAMISMWSYANVNEGVSFDLTNGVSDASWGGAEILDHSMTHVGNDWYRCTFTVNSGTGDASDSGNLYLYIDSAGGTTPTSYSGNGFDGLYIWGFQVEQATFPTSYIKTIGASATRSADNASIVGENFSSWYRQDEGSIYSEISSCLGSSNGGSRIFTIGENTTNNQIWLGDGIDSTGGTLFRVYKNGANQAHLLMNSEGSYGKFSACYKKDDFAGYFNAGNFKTDSAGEIPYVYKAKIGSQVAQEQGYLNGHIKKLAYYPQRLTNEQLQNLTK